MIEFVTLGTLLGLSAGFAPGPLLALVISETLQHDIKSGVKVALAPMITDLPIIVGTVFILSRLSHFHAVLGVISLAGSGFIFHMGYGSLTLMRITLNLPESRPDSLKKGVLVNALSPHPYLFWLSVGAPTMARAMEVTLAAALAFIGCFYLFLVGSKVLMAVVIGRSRVFLNGKVYLYIMRALGLALCGLSLALFRDALKLLGLV